MILALLGLALLLSPRTAAVTYTLEAVIELTGELYVTVWGVAVGDTDGDGRNELVVNYDWYWGPGGTPRLVFFEWDGSAYREESAVPGVSLGGRAWGTFPRQILLADADGDGDNDVTFAGIVGGVRGVYVYSWDGSGYVQIGSVPGQYWDVTVADGDGDGKSEIYAMTFTQVEVFEWGPSGPASSTSWDVPRIDFIKVGNADGDAEVEVVVGLDDLDIQTYRWTGSAYALEGSGSVPYGYIGKGLGIGDLDSDGQPEVFRVDYHRHMVVYGWNGSAFDVEWNGTSESDGDSVGHGEVGDADNDGTLEILVGHFNAVGGNSILVYEYRGGSYVVDWNSGWLPMYTEVLAVGDADNDGLREIVQGSGSQSRVRVFQGSIPQDAPPVARAAASPTSVGMGEVVTFSAAGSTDDRGIDSYLWEFGDGMTDTQWVAAHAYATRGTFVATLTVTDTGGQSDTDTVTVEVRNLPPTADAGPDQTRAKHDIVSLVGSRSSDPDGDSLMFLWTQTAGPVSTLSGTDQMIATFVPAVSGVYTFALAVADGWGGASTDTVSVTVANAPPTAVAGEDRTVRKKVSLSLDGSESTDPDGDSLTFLWTQVAGPAVNLVDAATVAPSFIPPNGGVYRFLLVVSDAEGDTADDVVEITAINTVPLANAGPDRTTRKRTLVPLDASASSDEDGDMLAFAWRQVGGPPSAILNAQTRTASFLPVSSGRYRFMVAVGDTDGAFAEDDVVIQVDNRPPVIDLAVPAQGSADILLGTRETFEVSASDSDNDLLAYEWTLDGAAVEGNGASFAFAPSETGTFIVNVTVSDGEAQAWREWRLTVDRPVQSQVLVDSWWPLAVLVAAFLGLLAVWWRRRRRDRPET